MRSPIVYIHKFKQIPGFIFFLPLFFVLHEFVENFHVALLGEACKQVILNITISLVLALLAFLYIKNFRKACIIAFFAMCFQFFFGYIHDFLKEHLSNSLWTKYTFLVPLSLILLIALAVYLKRSQRTFRQPVFFLNLLLIIFILIDLFSLSIKIIKSKPVIVADSPPSLAPCRTCINPDIYLILADEYPGQTLLTDIASFDNSAFLNELKQRKFHVIDNSRSNYNGTIYSLASMLNMGYLKDMQKKLLNHPDMFSCRKLINDNVLLRFLIQSGYKSVNYSQFDFGNSDNFIPTHFFASKSEFFNQNTFTSRIWKNTGYHFISKKQVEWSKRKHLRANEKVIAAVKNEASKKEKNPRFVYAHLIMPHHPYYFNSRGTPNSIESLSHIKEDRKAFTEYLLYTNKRLLDLIDHIKSSAATPPVILVMSDHGLRQFRDNSFNPYHFWNLNAVYLPDGNYKGFYTGMTNVNQFRVILNSQFGQALPLLKDSTIVVWQPDMKNAGQY